MGMWPQLCTSPWLSLDDPECPKNPSPPLTRSWWGSSLLPARFGKCADAAEPSLTPP